MLKCDARRFGSWQLWSLSIGLLASAAVAQGLPDLAGMKEAVQKQQQANEQALRQYTWKSRTEVRVGDEVKSTVLEMVRYDADGTLQKTVIGGQQSREKSRLLQKTPVGALVTHLRKKKAGEFKDELRKLLQAYAAIPAEKMQRFFEHASFQPGKDAMQGTLRISGTDVVNQGDTMNLWIDLTTREKRQLEILTALDGDPVQLVSHFDKLPDGTAFTSHTSVDVKPKHLTMLTENFDFSRVNTP
jgi:hypothetical protein